MPGNHAIIRLSNRRNIAVFSPRCAPRNQVSLRGLAERPTPRCACGSSDRQCKLERRARSGRRFDPNAAAVRFDDSFGDEKP